MFDNEQSPEKKNSDASSEDEGNEDEDINEQEKEMMNNLRKANKKSKKLAAIEMLKMIKSTPASRKSQFRHSIISPLKLKIKETY